MGLPVGCWCSHDGVHSGIYDSSYGSKDEEHIEASASIPQVAFYLGSSVGDVVGVGVVPTVLGATGYYTPTSLGSENMEPDDGAQSV